MEVLPSRGIRPSFLPGYPTRPVILNVGTHSTNFSLGRGRSRHLGDHRRRGARRYCLLPKTHAPFKFSAKLKSSEDGHDCKRKASKAPDIHVGISTIPGDEASQDRATQNDRGIRSNLNAAKAGCGVVKLAQTPEAHTLLMGEGAHTEHAVVECVYPSSTREGDRGRDGRRDIRVRTVSGGADRAGYPRPKDTLTCPICGQAEKLENVEREVCEFIRERIADRIRDVSLGVISGSNARTIAQTLRPERVYRFVAQTRK